MSELTLLSDVSFDTTSLSNIYIDEYMSSNNESQVKIYLYLLRHLSKGTPVSVITIADAFNYSVTDVERALFYMEKQGKRYLMEVKGCTLEKEGIGYFPDAPTERGIKHLHELARAAAEGFSCSLAYVIQMPGVTEVRPNIATHPEYGEALSEAKAAGVKVILLCCSVEPDELVIGHAIIGV